VAILGMEYASTAHLRRAIALREYSIAFNLRWIALVGWACKPSPSPDGRTANLGTELQRTLDGLESVTKVKVS